MGENLTSLGGILSYWEVSRVWGWWTCFHKDCSIWSPDHDSGFPGAVWRALCACGCEWSHGELLGAAVTTGSALELNSISPHDFCCPSGRAGSAGTGLCVQAPAALLKGWPGATDVLQVWNMYCAKREDIFIDETQKMHGKIENQEGYNKK